MEQQQPTFILADHTGKHQLELCVAGLTQAQSRAEDIANTQGRTVLVYSVTHVATYSPPVNDPTEPQA